MTYREPFQRIRAKKPCWYRIYIGSCPICQRNMGYRVRVTNEPRPEDRADRVVYLSDRQTYDWCDV